MKYKRLVIISSIVFGVVLLCVILCFTLFGLKNVELNFKNETSRFSLKEQQQVVINSGEFAYNTPIFSVRKKEIINRLELENPYLKVINIETVFPNKLIVHSAEREELFKIKIGENLNYICDDELKILRIDTNNTPPNVGNLCPITLNGVEVQDKTAKVGERLSFHNSEEIIKSISTAFSYNNKNIADLKAMFKEITLSYESNFYTGGSEAVLDFTTHDNFNIKIDLPKSNLVEKVNLMVALIPASVEKYSTHELVIAINPNNVSDTYIRYEKIQIN